MLLESIAIQWNMPGFLGQWAAFLARPDLILKKLLGMDKMNNDGKDVDIQTLSQAHYDVFMEQVATKSIIQFQNRFIQ